MSERPGTTPHPPETPEFGHVVPGGPAHEYETQGSMAVKKFSVGPFDNNVYVIRCTETNQALLVDGAADAARIMQELDGMQVVGIVQTHSHPDHVQALPDLVAALGVPVFAHPSDARGVPVETRPLNGGRTIKVGTIEISVLHTPGHTPGGLCFVAGSHLFSGDTLFPGGPGNTNDKRQAFIEIMRSVDKLFEQLSDDTRVSPGHGLDTTIGRERQYVEAWRARGW